MMPTFGQIPHRLIPGVSVSGASQPEGVTFTTNNAGGFGSAEWRQRTAPSVGPGDLVEISCEGGTWQGRVDTVTSGVGERLEWRVTCVGRFADLAYDETVEGVFVDRDISMWEATDCNNWSVASDFEINLDTAEGLHFAWPEADKTMVYQSQTQTDYAEHIGNAVPFKWAKGNFPKPDALWTASYYRMGHNKRITGLSYEITYCLQVDGVYGMKTSDYTNPIGPPDEKYGHRFAKYPKIHYWFDFYKLALHEFPRCLYFGVYACDAPTDLPFQNPLSMYTDPHLLKRYQPPTMKDTPQKVRVDCDAKLIVFYAAYLPVQFPFNLGTRYSKKADHLVRTKWVARNRIFLPTSDFGPQWVDVKNISVYSQGYTSKPDGSDDLADVFKILFPTCEVDAMPLPAPADDTAPTSIVLREPTTKLAAIPDLLSLYPVDMCWGVWEDGILKVEHDAGTVSVGDGPGVDTTNAALSDEGAVDLVLVEFTPTPTTTPLPGRLYVPTTSFLTVDKDGSWALVAEGWTPGAGVRAAYLDATDFAHNVIAAARAGQLVAISRRKDQWTGSINLKAIAGASCFRAGKTISAPGVSGALITSTSVDVDNDSVSLSLGNTGYMGRFPARVPGKPMTASPNGGRRMRRELRRQGGRRKR